MGAEVVFQICTSPIQSVVRVPSVEEEDRRQLHRDMLTAKQDRTRGINRLKGL
jgi:hypothetical protein